MSKRDRAPRNLYRFTEIVQRQSDGKGHEGQFIRTSFRVLPHPSVIVVLRQLKAGLRVIDVEAQLVEDWTTVSLKELGSLSLEEFSELMF
jgi:hypothetical protein